VRDATENPSTTKRAEGDLFSSGCRAYPPNALKRFKSPDHEFQYLHDRLDHCVLTRKQPSRARALARRAKIVMSRIPGIEWTIDGNRCMALVAEVEADWAKVVSYRRRQIGLIASARELAKTERPDVKKAMLTDPLWNRSASAVDIGSSSALLD
jgi:hypothetical protein